VGGCNINDMVLPQNFHVHTYILTHMHMCEYVCMCVPAYVQQGICDYVCICGHACLTMHEYVYMHMYDYVCMCIYERMCAYV
jgi:hypothetical protein